MRKPPRVVPVLVAVACALSATACSKGAEKADDTPNEDPSVGVPSSTASAGALVPQRVRPGEFVDVPVGDDQSGRSRISVSLSSIRQGGDDDFNVLDTKTRDVLSDKSPFYLTFTIANSPHSQPLKKPVSLYPHLVPLTDEAMPAQVLETRGETPFPGCHGVDVPKDISPTTRRFTTCIVALADKGTSITSAMFQDNDDFLALWSDKISSKDVNGGGK